MLNNCKFMFRLTLVFALVFVTIVACGLQPKVTELPYQGIEQKYSSGTGTLFEGHQPSVVVISRQEEVGSLKGLITGQAQLALLELDYSEHFALIAFQGWKPSSRYSIIINRITRAGNTVNTYVQLNDPKPDIETLDVETSPYDLVIVKKDGNWGADISFNLIADDKVVASASYRIP